MSESLSDVAARIYADLESVSADRPKTDEAPTRDRPTADLEPTKNKDEISYSQALINHARKLEKTIAFCYSCKIKFPATNKSLLDQHHLIPRTLRNEPFFKDVSPREWFRTVDLCPTCHRIAHVIINDSKLCNWQIVFWDKEELRKGIKSFKDRFCRLSS